MASTRTGRGSNRFDQRARHRDMLLSLPAILPRFDFRVEFAVANDIGARREHNEDAFVLAPEFALFAVADGMGGHRARRGGGSPRCRRGSRSARAPLESAGPREIRGSPRPRVAARRLRLSPFCVRARERSGAEVTPLKTPITPGWAPRSTWCGSLATSAFIAHAGDGRVYLARSRATLQLTQDHTSTSDAPRQRRRGDALGSHQRHRDRRGGRRGHALRRCLARRPPLALQRRHPRPGRVGERAGRAAPAG